MASPSLALNSLLPLAGALPPLLPTGSGRQPGPVTDAIRAMRREEPPLPLEWLADLAAGRAALQNLRKRIADRVEHDLAILDALDGDADCEDENEHGCDINDEPHDPEEDSGADDAGAVSYPAQFSGYNYCPVSAR